MILAVILVFGYFLTFFVIGTLIKNNSIVDVGWGLGFVLVGWILYIVHLPAHLGALIGMILVSLWGLRLFYHILKRNLFQEEDFRYKKWREDWGKNVVVRAFFQVYLLQACFLFGIGSTVFYLNTHELAFPWVAWFGVAVALVGYLVEVVADRQLKRHIANRKGTLMTSGLWAYSRHPNYFGEALFWWGIYLFALLLGAPWYLIVSPVAISYVLVFVSTPLLERRMETREGWEAYRANTSLFVPLPKKVKK